MPPVNIVIVVAMLWGLESPLLLLVWGGLVWFSSLIRFVMYRRFDRAVDAGKGYEAFWTRAWIGAYGLSGAVWGIGSMLMLPQDSFLLEAFLALFVLGMAAGGTASFAPYSPALIAYLVPLVLPPTLVLLAQDTGPHIILGVGGCVFLLALVCLGRAGTRSYRESFLLGFQNEALSRDLTAAQMRLAGALDSMSEAFALFDADGRLVECNNKFDEILPEIKADLASGISFEEFFGLLGKSGRVKAAAGRAGEWTAEVIRRCETGDLPIEIELSDDRWLMLNRAPTADGGMVTTFADISDLKRHEAEISDSEQRYRDFSSAASDWVWELDQDSRFVYISGRFAEVSGQSPDSYIGSKLVDFPPYEKRGDWDRLLAALETRQPFRNVRAVREYDNGDVFHFLLNGLPIFGPSGQYLGFRGTGTDITATVKAENRARLAQSQLFEAIESIPAGFILFDSQGRLTLWNSRAPLYLPGAGKLIVSGNRFETLMRGCANSGEIIDADGRVDDWVNEQSAWVAAPDLPREIRFSDGRYVQFQGRKTADGGTVCVVTDITDIRRGQDELAEKTTFLQATLEGMGEGLVVLGSDLCAVLSNTRLDRLAVRGDSVSVSGQQLQDILTMIGAEPLPLHGLAEGDDLIQLLETRFAEGSAFQLEVSRIGRQILMVRADPVPTGGWVCVFTDVTAERRALSALEESEDRYRRLTEASPDMIAVHTRGRFVFVNPAGAHLLGVSSVDDLLGRRLLDFVHPDDHATARNSPPMSSFDDDLDFREFLGMRRDGTVFNAEALGTEFMYQGEPSILVIWRDITERKLAQAQLVQTSKLALLGEMAASMAHELNQPLNIIRMAADSSLILMEEDKADFESHREEFERISNQTERMANIINHLRVFSRQEEAGEIHFDPVESINAATTMIHDQYLLDGVEVRTVLPKRTAQVRGQPIRLEQVILNLLANARDAVLESARRRPGNESGQSSHSAGVIEVSAFLSNDRDAQGEGWRPEEIVITVSDDGGGLPADIMGHVFEPFFTTKRAGEGTGLGLAIGYSIISGMGGAIAASNGARGAVFEIRLPVANPEHASAQTPVQDLVVRG